MKLIHKRMAWFGCIILLGIALIILSITGTIPSNTFTAMGSAFVIVGLLKLIQFYRISKNPKLLQKFEIAQKEERIIFIAQKSCSWTFWLMAWGEVVAMIVAVCLGNNDIATVLGYLVCIQLVIYLFSYYVLSKKY